MDLGDHVHVRVCVHERARAPARFYVFAQAELSVYMSGRLGRLGYISVA